MTRSRALDGMRVVAAGSVVLLHVCAYQLGRGSDDLVVRLINGLSPWGMPFFLPVAGYLHARSRRATADPARWRLQRAIRIGIPYLAWTAAYVAYRVITTRASGGAMPNYDPLTLLFAGQANSSLWFLPAVLYAGLLVSFLAARRPIAVLGIVSLLAACVAIVASVFVPLAPFAHRLSLAVAAYCLGYLTGGSPREIPRPWALLPAAAALAVVTAALIAWLPAIAAPTPAYAAGMLAATLGAWSVGMLVFAWAIAAPSDVPPSRLAPAGRLVLGVYASHTLVVMLIASILPVDALPPLAWVAAVFPLALAVAFALSWVVSMVPGVRRVVT